jgi:hypothetical protein
MHISASAGILLYECNEGLYIKVSAMLYLFLLNITGDVESVKDNVT